MDTDLRIHALCLADFDQLLPSSLAHFQLPAIHENDGAIGLPLAIDFLNLIEIDDRRAMDTNELPGVQLVAQIGDALAQHVTSTVSMSAPTRPEDELPWAYYRLANIAQQLKDDSLLDWAVNGAITSDSLLATPTGAAVGVRAFVIRR